MSLVPVEVCKKGSNEYKVMWFGRIPMVGEQIEINDTLEPLESGMEGLYEVVAVTHMPLHCKHERDFDGQWFSKPHFPQPMSFIAQCELVPVIE